MKKILVVTESNSIWGAERSLLKLAKYAESNDVALHFLISDQSPLAGDLEELGLPYERHQFASHPALDSTGSLSNAGICGFFREITSVLQGGARIWRKLRRFDSVLVFSIWQAPETIIGSWLARTPVDIDFHETFNNRLAMRLVGLISRASRHFIVPSNILAARSGLEVSGRVSVIPRPVESTSEQLSLPRCDTNLPMTVGVFGQIQPHKNVLEVARAVSSARSGIRLLVVGGKPMGLPRTDYELEVRRIVSEMSYGSTVFDFVSDVTELMSLCDVIVNASEHEAFGRTIVEAVSVGCYPISVGDWGPRETIAALGVGRSVNTIDELRSVLTELARSRQKGPLLDALPPTLKNYEARAVAERYFSLLTSMPLK